VAGGTQLWMGVAKATADKQQRYFMDRDNDTIGEY